MATERKDDWFLGDETDSHVAAVIPRVLPIEPNGTIIMVRHKRGKGALGGHITKAEAAEIYLANLLDLDSLIPTLDRESEEEGGVPLGRYLRTKAAVLGLAEVLMVHRDRGTSVDTFTPMVLCKIPGGLPFNRDVIRIPWGHIPPHTYPDAALALIHLYSEKRSHANGPILPAFLNLWGKVIFELSPKRRYLSGRPPFEKLGYVFKAPSIPRQYPSDVRRWLRDQYERL